MNARSFPLVLCLGAALVFSCRDASAAGETQAAPVPVVELLPSGLRVKVELARTPSEQARGLMWREALEPGEGMLFLFQEDEDRTFWMKNTLIPLDMIFISRDLVVVGVVHEAPPLTTLPRSVGAASRYVLEVPGGYARAHAIEAGTRVRFENVPRPTPAP